jgi:hypothetical protein
VRYFPVWPPCLLPLLPPVYNSSVSVVSRFSPVRRRPEPRKEIIGDLSDPGRVLAGLEIHLGTERNIDRILSRKGEAEVSQRTFRSTAEASWKMA